MVFLDCFYLIKNEFGSTYLLHVHSLLRAVSVKKLLCTSASAFSWQAGHTCTTSSMGSSSPIVLSGLLSMPRSISSPFFLKEIWRFVIYPLSSAMSKNGLFFITGRSIPSMTTLMRLPFKYSSNEGYFTQNGSIYLVLSLNFVIV